MSFDIVVFDDDFKYARQLHMDAIISKALFRKLITAEGYPYLHMADNDKEDLIFEREDVPILMKDVEKLVNYLETEKLMATEVKAHCLNFARGLLDACSVAIETNHTVDFIAGE